MALFSSTGSRVENGALSISEYRDDNQKSADLATGNGTKTGATRNRNAASKDTKASGLSNLFADESILELEHLSPT